MAQTTNAPRCRIVRRKRSMRVGLGSLEATGFAHGLLEDQEELNIAS